MNKAKEIIGGVLGGIIVLAGLTYAILNSVEPDPTVKNNNQATSRAPVVANNDTCNYDSAKFLAQMNSYREAKGLTDFDYNYNDELAASYRLNDMETNNYYGHVNPVTKADAGTFLTKLGVYGVSWGELVDAPNDPSNSVQNFINSAPHDAIIVNPMYTKLGIVSNYEPKSILSYDDNGNPDNTQNVPSCIVDVVLTN